MKTWNIGVIGAGMVADFHAKSIESLPNTKLAGICDSGSGKAKLIAEKYGCPVFADYNAMLHSDAIDIVTIATPSGMHKAPAVEAAKCGKHVLCEKPLEISLDSIDAMIEAHEKAGTYLGGIFNYRFNDSVKHLKQAVVSGKFGTITHAAIAVPWWRSDAYYQNKWRGTWSVDGGGAIMNQSIHMVDMLQYMMGPVDTLYACMGTLGHNIETEDTAAAVLKFRNNAIGSIYGSTASFPGQARSIMITGTKGTAVMEDNYIKIWQFDTMTDEDTTLTSRYKAPEQAAGASDPAAIPFELHAKNIAAFTDAIDAGRPFEIDGHEARKAVALVLALYTSAKENRAFTF
jgi:predicted dehydrogenase